MQRINVEEIAVNMVDVQLNASCVSCPSCVSCIVDVVVLPNLLICGFGRIC